MALDFPNSPTIGQVYGNYEWSGTAWIAKTITGDTINSVIHAAASKVTPVDADEIGLVDSAAAWGIKKLTWANLKATLLSTWKDATGGLAGLTLFKINFRNAADTFTSFLTNSNTAARTYTFQDRDGTIADNTDLAGKASVGKQTIWIPAGAMVPRTTLPPAAGSVETTTNKVMLKTLDYDAAANEYAQVAIQMPKSWNESTITAKFLWKHAATTTNFGVVWGIQGVALSDNDAAEAAFGTAVTVTDTGGTTNNIYSTAETSALTIAGTPAVQDWVVLQIYRDAANGSDTMAIDAGLLGVQLFYTTDGVNDA